VMLYGLLSLSSKSGLKEIFQCSMPGVPKQITTALAQIRHPSETVTAPSIWKHADSPTLPAQPAGHEPSEASREIDTFAESKLPKGVYFCQVKGIPHNNDDGTRRSEAIQHCSIGDSVKLISDPGNVHDHNAIRVVLPNGQQVGYIGARQAARFAGKVQFLTASIHSHVKDEWGNDTIKLRVVNSLEEQEYERQSAASTAGESQTQAPALEPTATSIQAEARETAKKEGWQSAFVYFENDDGTLYKILSCEDPDLMLQALKKGFVRVGLVSAKDALKGINFGFVLDDSFSVNDPIGKRFLVNAREWVVARAKELSAQKGAVAPVIHNFQFNKKFLDAQEDSRNPNAAGPKSKT
jgi:HIRAN domain